MLLTGSEDNIASSELAVLVGKSFKNLIGFQIDGGGHYIHANNADLVAELVMGFVDDGVALMPDNTQLDYTITSPGNMANSQQA